MIRGVVIGCVGSVALFGCLTKANPHHGRGEGAGTGGAGGDGSTSGTTASPSSTGSTGSASTTASTGSDPDTSMGESSAASTTSPGMARLVISDGPVYDFTLASIGSTASHGFAVTNAGDVDATGIVPDVLSEPYAFVGGSFPGTDGDCTESLAAGESCSVDVAFSPVDVGIATGMLALAYDSPDGPAIASVALTGAGGGTTDNLIVNPGGEDGGMPPVGWTDIGSTGWEVYDGIRRSGNVSLAGPIVAGVPGTYRLEQTFDLAGYAQSIDDQGGLVVSYAGYARSWGVNDDFHRFRLQTRDAAGDVVGSTVSANGTGTNWVFRELELVTEPGVRLAEIQIICEYNGGGACDAYFDDLSLHLTYPAP